MKFANFHDILVIGVFAYAFIYLANRGLDRMGLGEFQTAQE